MLLCSRQQQIAYESKLYLTQANKPPPPHIKRLPIFAK